MNRVYCIVFPCFLIMLCCISCNTWFSLRGNVKCNFGSHYTANNEFVGRFYFKYSWLQILWSRCSFVTGQVQNNVWELKICKTIRFFSGVFFWFAFCWFYFTLIFRALMNGIMACFAMQGISVVSGFSFVIASVWNQDNSFFFLLFLLPVALCCAIWPLLNAAVERHHVWFFSTVQQNGWKNPPGIVCAALRSSPSLTVIFTHISSQRIFLQLSQLTSSIQRVLR